MQFERFFKEVVNKNPFPYQTRLAEMPSGRFPRLLNVPTGSGKTAAVVVAWLWRRFLHPDEGVRRETPRRLVYCLPSRVLVEQTRSAIDEYVGRFADVVGQVLGRTVKPPSVTTLMGGSGGESRSERDHWLLFPEAEQVLVGTQDMLLSRALNRGYGSTRFAWPREFGLLNNDVLWVFDEVQLMSSGLGTSAQLEAMRARFGAFGPVHSLWLSATLEPSWLATVDHPKPTEADILRLDAADEAKAELAERLKASKLLRRAEPVVPEKASGIVAYARDVALLVVERHKAETLSLVVVNTIPRARAIHEVVKRELGRTATPPELILVHSHFRAADRKDLVATILSPTPTQGRILISTQVVEAGVDISARVLFTELAPWGSMVQRLGRCNRYGEAVDAEAYWFDVDDKASAPYSPEELAGARSTLGKLPGAPGEAQASPEALAGSPIPCPRPTQVLRAPDLVGLFDTTPDLSGFDVDVSRFIRDSQDHDMQVFWRKWNGDWPPEAMEAPREAECCPAPIGDVRDMLAKQRGFWRWDQLVGRWVKANPRDIYPGQTLLMDAAGGGYTRETGWEPASRKPVDEVQLAPAAGRQDAEKPPSKSAKQAAGQESFGTDRSSIGTRRWVSIVEHTDVTVKTAQDIIKELGALLASSELAQALLRAARWHDRGKAHPEFQVTLLSNVPEGDRPDRDTLWAKSPGGRIKHRRPYFRHELASAMAYLGQQDDGSDQLPDAVGGASLFDLVAYLIAAHHGRVRVSIRSMPREEPPGHGVTLRHAMGLREGDLLPATELGSAEVAEAATINLSVMEIGMGAGETASWLERTTGLRDSQKLGPFRLAFLEAILRAADSRASMEHEKGGASGG
jgi:CRISPR-associated endonuclease/helicase Cas3